MIIFIGCVFTDEDTFWKGIIGWELGQVRQNNEINSGSGTIQVSYKMNTG